MENGEFTIFRLFTKWLKDQGESYEVSILSE
jgi:hypothetical protein